MKKENIYNQLAGWLLVLSGAGLLIFGGYLILGGATLLGYALIPIILSFLPLITGIFIIKNKDWAKMTGLIISILATLILAGNLLTKYKEGIPSLVIVFIITNIVSSILLIIGVNK